MSARLALCVCALFVLWLFARDAKRSSGVSRAIWIPLLWAAIIGSRPISLWLGISAASENADGSTEDGPLDKALFMFLIGAALFVLARRRVLWGVVVSNNKWLAAFFAYLVLSVLWADDSFVSLKRWVKDFGNILMVLVILTEADPLEAVRAFFARCAYFLIPVCLLVVRYFPTVSRMYKQWTDEVVFVGIATDKNMLGMTLSVCGLALFWMLLEARTEAGRRKDKSGWMRYGILVLMTVWLLATARSSTAMTCSVIGAAILLAMRAPALRNMVRMLGPYTAAAVVLVLLLQACGLWSELMGAFARMVGRDPTFHGRTDIWRALLKEDLNPLLGVGYYSFWSLDRMQRISEGYHSALNEAHNGYLETYLNSGLIGVFLLLGVLASAAKSIKTDLLNGQSYAALRFAFLVANLFYAMSEAIFNRLSLMWFALLVASIRLPAGCTASCWNDSRQASATPVDPGLTPPLTHPGSGTPA